MARNPATPRLCGLTQRVNELIEGSSNSDIDRQAEALSTQRRAMELAAEPDAYARFREMYPL